MGDRRRQALRVQSDGKLKLEFHGTRITSDAGLLVFRELDEAFRLTEKGSTVLSDPRPGKNTQHSMLAMLRQGIYGRSPAVGAAWLMPQPKERSVIRTYAGVPYYLGSYFDRSGLPLNCAARVGRITDSGLIYGKC